MTPSPNAQMLTAIENLHLNDLTRLAQAHPDWPNHPRDQDDPLLAVLTRYDAPTQQGWRRALTHALLAPVTPRAVPGRTGHTARAGDPPDDSNARHHLALALGCAAWKGWPDLVELLVPLTDPNASPLGQTPLRLATSEAHLEVIDRLGPHVDPNVPDADGITPLMLAAGGNRMEVVERLMALPGLDLDRTDRLGHTALMHALRASHVDAALRLIDAGANPNVQEHEHGQTALTIAIVYEAFELVDRWLARDSQQDPDSPLRLNLLLRTHDGRTVDAIAEEHQSPHLTTLVERRQQQEAALLRAAMPGVATRPDHPPINRPGGRPRL